MKLEIIKYIRQFGIEKTCKDFNLKIKDYGHKIIIKYDQIESDFNNKIVTEARGLVLSKDNFEVMSMGFIKFFNAGESYSTVPKIDWDSAQVFEKLDGSCMTLYFDWIKNEWCVATTGTAEGEGEVNKVENTSFSELFFDTLNISLENIPKENCYIFELCTPYNIVVKPHSTSNAFLLTVRNRKTLNEYNYTEVKSIANKYFNSKVVERYDLKNISVENLRNTFENMPFTEEGYVVCDKNFNRLKIKNPAYVAAHHLKSKSSPYAIIEIIKNNEVEEYIATFTERKEEIYKLHDNYLKLIYSLESDWKKLKNNTIGKSQKEFATEVFKLCKITNNQQFSGLFFSLNNGKIKNVKEYIKNFNNRKLYDIIKVK